MTSLLRPTIGVRFVGRLPAVPRVRIGGKVPRQAVDHELKQADATRDVVELVLAEGQRVLAGGQVHPDQVGGRLRQEDLSRVGRGRDPDDPLDVQAGVAVAVQLG